MFVLGHMQGLDRRALGVASATSVPTYYLYADNSQADDLSLL